MPDFNLIATRARDEAFKTRVRGVLVYKARQVYLAGVVASGEASFNFAIGVLREVGQYEGTASWALSTDSAIIGVALATAISDTDLEAAMTRSWPALVGIRA